MSIERLDYGSPEGSLAIGAHRQVILGITTQNLTAADSGALCLFNTAAGTEFVLPTPMVVGMWFEFGFPVITSGEYKLVTGTIASEFLLGTISGFTTDITEVDSFVADGSADVSVSMNATATGGDAGGFIKVVAISTTQWWLTGDLYCGTTAPTTPIDTS